jgi:hypothetical protein
MQRYAPERSFPSYAFIPGENIHPNKEGGHFFGMPELTSSHLSTNNSDYLYAIDLMNNAYYWEAHVYLEAIWNAHKRTGPEADFCKGLIKMSAAALKYKMGSHQSFVGHLERAIDLFTSIIDAPLITGISPKKLVEVCSDWRSSSFVKLELTL